MDKNKLTSLIKKNEGPKLDFKLKLSINTNSEKKEICKDISAIANTQGGRGYIIFGIEDKTKRAVGIEIDESMEEKIQQIITNRIDPPIPIRMEYTKYNNTTIGVLTIFKSIQRPHQIRQNGTFYVRRGSTTDVARRHEIAIMFQDEGLISIEMMPIYSASLKELNEKLIYKYCEKININDDISIELLENIGACVKVEEKYYPTVGGVLLFGEYPQKHLISTSIRVINDLEDETIFKIFQGNILTMLDEVEFYIKNILKYISYPIDGLCECIRNSLVHRDYFNVNKEIVVYIGRNKVEVSNPGSLCVDDNVNNVFKEKNPFRRNNLIYQRLLILDDKRRFLGSGMGFNRIKQCFEGMGDVKFINVCSRNMFKVILPGINIKKQL